MPSALASNQSRLPPALKPNLVEQVLIARRIGIDDPVGKALDRLLAK
jgi:hypothetical protein